MSRAGQDRLCHGPLRAGEEAATAILDYTLLPRKASMGRFRFANGPKALKATSSPAPSSRICRSMSFFPPARLLWRLPPCPAHEAAIEAARTPEPATKPAGSLGRLEDIAIFMAGWQNRTIPRSTRATDLCRKPRLHGSWRQRLSGQRDAGHGRQLWRRGAAINALAGFAGMDLTIVPSNSTAHRRFHPRPGDERGRMPRRAQCRGRSGNARSRYPDRGRNGHRQHGLGPALCAHSLGGSAADWVGPGSGLDPEGVARKAAVVGQALGAPCRCAARCLRNLRRLGGREVPPAGATLAARAQRIPVVLDGFINCAALAPLFVDNPAIVDHCLAGHCSAEPGHVRILETFGLSPLLAGPATGRRQRAALAVPIIRAALAAHAQMATFADAGVEKSL
jgi:nicotinate-nucleotide--dimethylbenzimidazole phosphoribosyltransferase